MDRKQAEIRINELKLTLIEASRKYYVDNAPIMSDFDFDMLLKELERLEAAYPEFASDDSPTRQVGSDRQKEFMQYPHRYPMLSLGNTYDITEVQAFAERSSKSIGNAFTGHNSEQT